MPKKTLKIVRANRQSAQSVIDSQTRMMNSMISSEVSRNGHLQKNLDKMYDEALEFSPYKKIANALLNPGHQHNVQEALPFPDGSPGDVYLHKSIVLGTIRIPAGTVDPSFTIALTPFAEVPAAVRFGTENKWAGIHDLSYTTGGGAVTRACNYPHLMGVYAHRLIGKSLTLDNDTPEMYRAGNITSCRMPSNVDNNLPSTVSNGARAALTNYRVIQSVPDDAGQIALNLNASNWHAKEGAYLVSHPDLSWTTREFPWNKSTSVYNGTSPATTDAIDNVAISNMSSTDRTIFANALGWGTDTTLVPGMSSLYNAVVNGQDNSDVVVSFVEGLNTSVDNIFKFKLCIVREFRLKNSSPLLKMAIRRPVANARFLEELLKYSASAPGIYPADFNFWDKLWQGFKSVLSGISRALPGISTVVAPMLPPQAKAALGLANLINGGAQAVINTVQKTKDQAAKNGYLGGATRVVGADPISYGPGL